MTDGPSRQPKHSDSTPQRPEGRRRNLIRAVVGGLALGAAATAGVLLSQDNGDDKIGYYQYALGRRGVKPNPGKNIDKHIGLSSNSNESQELVPAAESTPEESARQALNILNEAITKLPDDLKPIADIWIKNILDDESPLTLRKAIWITEVEFPVLIDIGKLDKDKRATAFKLIKDGELPSNVWVKIAADTDSMRPNGVLQSALEGSVLQAEQLKDIVQRLIDESALSEDLKIMAENSLKNIDFDLLPKDLEAFTQNKKHEIKSLIAIGQLRNETHRAICLRLIKEGAPPGHVWEFEIQALKAIDGLEDEEVRRKAKHLVTEGTSPFAALHQI